jgi:hypothetical protein
MRPTGANRVLLLGAALLAACASTSEKARLGRADNQATEAERQMGRAQASMGDGKLDDADDALNDARSAMKHEDFEYYPEASMLRARADKLAEELKRLRHEAMITGKMDALEDKLVAARNALDKVRGEDWQDSARDLKEALEDVREELEENEGLESDARYGPFASKTRDDLERVVEAGHKAQSREILKMVQRAVARAVSAGRSLGRSTTTRDQIARAREAVKDAEELFRSAGSFQEDPKAFATARAESDRLGKVRSAIARSERILAFGAGAGGALAEGERAYRRAQRTRKPEAQRQAFVEAARAYRRCGAEAQSRLSADSSLRDQAIPTPVGARRGSTILSTCTSRQASAEQAMRQTYRSARKPAKAPPKKTTRKKSRRR